MPDKPFGHITETLMALKTRGVEMLTSAAVWQQALVLVLAVVFALLARRVLRHRIARVREGLVGARTRWLRAALTALGHLLGPLLLLAALALMVEPSRRLIEHVWLLRLAQGAAIVWLGFRLATLSIRQPMIVGLLKWGAVPLGMLYVFGWLDEFVAYLDGVSLTAGNIRISLFALARTLFFGAFLFWLGRVSNILGKDAIRRQQGMDVGTREVFAKLFEIGLFVLIFILLLQVMGINLTALAVFGGALGVGLGFGLQQVASNFICGIIILLDRAISIGDYLELDDGRSGTLRELNMRYGILESFDGKDILVPNERFITTTFVNWTKKNHKQRYALRFSVAYDSDIERLLPLVRDLVADHPQVLSGPGCASAEQPDAEIAHFGDSGIEILVEFWMVGIDDGENHVCADLHLAIWRALKDHGFNMPFPQREIRVLNSSAGGASVEGLV